MKKIVISLTMIVLGLLIAVIGCGKNPYVSSLKGGVFVPLEFPFKTPANIQHMTAFGVPNWSGPEPHNGIDLVVYDSLTNVKIIAPCAGLIKVDIKRNPYSTPPDLLLLTVNVQINSEWTVGLIFEPMTDSKLVENNQISAIKVKDGDFVKAGDEIGDLLVGNKGYVHLHYMVTRNQDAVCAYANSSAGAKQIFEQIAATRSNNNLPNGNICY